MALEIVSATSTQGQEVLIPQQWAKQDGKYVRHFHYEMGRVVTPAREYGDGGFRVIVSIGSRLPEIEVSRG